MPFEEAKLLKLIKRIQDNDPKFTFLNCQALNLSDSEIALIGSALVHNQTITHIDFSHNHMGILGTTSLAISFMKNTTIRDCNLSNNQLGPESIKQIALAFAQNTSVRSLKLNANQIDNIGAKHLGMMLAENSTLKALYLWNNCIEDAGLKYISEGISAKSKLTLLNLGGNFIADQGALYLNQALINHDTVTELDLSSNLMGKNSLKALMSFLIQTKSLTHLNLKANQVGSLSMEYLKVVLLKNNTLRSLNLQGNALADQGVDFLCDALENNTGLNELDLSSNHITDTGAARLSFMLAKNKTLQTLNLAHNLIQDPGGHILSVGLLNNANLSALALQHNSLSPKQLQAIAKLVQRNLFQEKLQNYSEILQQKIKKIGLRATLLELRWHLKKVQGSTKNVLLFEIGKIALEAKELLCSHVCFKHANNFKNSAHVAQQLYGKIHQSPQQVSGIEQLLGLYKPVENLSPFLYQFSAFKRKMPLNLPALIKMPLLNWQKRWQEMRMQRLQKKPGTVHPLPTLLYTAKKEVVSKQPPGDEIFEMFSTPPEFDFSHTFSQTATRESSHDLLPNHSDYSLPLMRTQDEPSSHSYPHMEEIRVVYTPIKEKRRALFRED